MARIRKPQPTLEGLFFSTPEQKVLRFLLSEPTTTFTSRVISSKLKGVRGLGGAEGITRILNEFETLGVVEFLDNRRSVRLKEDCPCVLSMKTFVSICDLEGLKKLLEPISKKGVLFGSRASGKSRSDSDYNLLVVSDLPEEVKKVALRYPLGKQLDLVTVSQDGDLERQNPVLAQRLTKGIVVWGTTW